MEIEDKETKRKRLASARQRAYYLRNAERLRQQSQTNRDDLIRLRLPVVVPIIQEPPDTITEFSLENIINGLYLLPMNSFTKQRNIKDITTVFRITGSTDLEETIKKFKIVKKAITEAKQIQNPEIGYSNNSLKGFVQAILYVIDHLNVPIKTETKLLYNEWFDELKLEAVGLTEAKQNDPTHAVLLLPDYLHKILTEYGADSKQYLIAKMYAEVPARDNFYNLEIISSLRKRTTSLTNFVVVPKSVKIPVKIIIQSYKTVNRYGVRTIVLSPELSTLIRNYIKKYDLTELLFPQNTAGLSPYIGTMNRKIGVNGSINKIRQMFATTILNNEDITSKERVNLSKMMMNSPIMPLVYQRIIMESVV